MGVEAKLLINGRWDYDDLSTVIQSYLETEHEPRFKPWDFAPGSGSIIFRLKGEVVECKISYHSNYQTPLGPCTMLTMSASMAWRERSWKVLGTIGMVLGGVFCKDDTGDEWEIIDGLFHEEDGFSYHFKHAILTKALKFNRPSEERCPTYAILEQDTVGLAKSIKDWDEKIKGGKK